MTQPLLKSILFTCAATGICLAQAPQVCNFNLFVFGNDTASYSDVQGNVAVGGDANVTGFDFGQDSPANPGANSLVVGGSFTFTNGQLENGSVVAGGNVTLQNVTIVNGNVVAGGNITLTNGQINGTQSPNSQSPLPIDFVGATSFLQNASSFYGSLTPNGQTINKYGGLVLTGTDPNLNIFSVTGSLLASVWGVQINVPSTSTVLINVSGTSDTLPNVGYSYSGASAGTVLFNFFQATTLQIGAGQGTVLAPFAAVTFPSGAVNGTVIANSYSGNGQINSAPFVGTLPTLPSGFGFCGNGGGGGNQRQ